LEQWKKDRGALEKKWQKNLDAFRCVSSDYWKEKEAEEWRSNTFVPLTKTKVLGAWSIIIDLLLMNNRIPFDLKPSPWDDVTMDDMDQSYQDAINDSIHDMKGLIDQQFVDCNADRALMKCVMSAAIYGETYAKFYVYELVRKMFKSVDMAPQGIDPAKAQQFQRFERTEERKNAPGIEYWSIWNVYRDLETNDIQEGIGVILTDTWSPFHLRKRAGQGEESYYLDNNIEEAIKTADKTRNTASTKDSSSLPPGKRDIQNSARTLDMVEFWGRAPTKLVESFEAEMKNDGKTISSIDQYERDGNETEIMCLLAGDHIVRFSRNEEGHRPIYRAVWEDILDEPGGTGVPDNLESIQKPLNGMVRSFEDNKKLSSNIQGIGNSEKAPDWDHKMFPGLFIDVDDTVDDVSKVWSQFIVQDVGESLLNGISLYERFGDDASMLPKIMQGAVLDKRKPDTFGEMSMLQANAGKYIGGVMKNLDEGLLENWAQDFYEYNMDDPDIQKGKGSFIAQALGYSSYQDRIVRVNKIMQALQLITTDPEMKAECKLDKMLFEAFKAMDMDVANFIKTSDEKAAENEARMNSPEAKAQQEMLVHSVQKASLDNQLTDAQTKKTLVDAEVDKGKLDLAGFKTGVDTAKVQEKPNAV
jgi:hypothetical protein